MEFGIRSEVLRFPRQVMKPLNRKRFQADEKSQMFANRGVLRVVSTREILGA